MIKNLVEQRFQLDQVNAKNNYSQSPSLNTIGSFDTWIAYKGGRSICLLPVPFLCFLFYLRKH